MVNSISLFKPSGVKAEEKPTRTSVDSKVSNLFREPAHSAALFRTGPVWTKKQILRNTIGAAGGTVLATFATTTGPMVALHEVVGHGLLGVELTKGSGSSPTYHINGWENFQKIGEASSFKGGVAAFFHWLFPFGDDSVAGRTYVPYNQPNDLGEAMGSDGRDAWISLAGSIPGLVVDTLAVAGGMQVRKTAPTLGSAMVGFGLMDNFGSMTYPISAAMMNESQLKQNAASGHDFANFAIRMSDITGVSAHAIAVSTAVFWATFVPIIAAVSYMHTRSENKEIVPDVLALKHWVEKAKNDPKIAEELEKYYQDYPYKGELTGFSVNQLRASPAFNHFLGYLLDQVPRKRLAACKKEILASWDKNLPTDRIQKVLTGAAVIGMGVAATSAVLRVLALAFPILHTAASVLCYASPVFIGISVISAGYQVYKDFQCPDSVVPKAAKMLSIAKFVATLASAALMTTALVMPGLYLGLIGILLIGTLVNVILNSVRTQVIRDQFIFQKAMSPEVWNVMYPLWKSRDAAKIPMNLAIKTWVDCVSKKVDLKNIQAAPTVPLLRPHDLEKRRFQVSLSENVGNVLASCPSV